MAAVTQKGLALKVGFTGSTVTGLIMEDVNKEATGEQTVIKDENNATGTVIISDAGNRIAINAIVKDDYGGALPPALGTSFQAGAVVYRVESASYKQIRLQNTLNVTGIKEDSMTYTV